MFSGVYGPVNKSVREALWSELEDIRDCGMILGALVEISMWSDCPTKGETVRECLRQ